MIAKSEKDFIIRGIENNIRIDARQRLSARSVKIETDLIPQASGSAYVQVKGHGSEVLASVSVAIENLTSIDEASEDNGLIKTRVLWYVFLLILVQLELLGNLQIQEN
jgi:exosome complex component RRP42